MNRPVSVAVLAVLVFLSAVYNIVIGVIFMLSIIGTNPGFTDLAGNVHEVSGWYLFFTGAVDVLFGLLMVWLGRMTLAGSRTAYMLINVLAIINISFGMLSLPYGWGMVAINIVALVLVNTRGARDFLTQAA